MFCHINVNSVLKIYLYHIEYQTIYGNDTISKSIIFDKKSRIFTFWPKMSNIWTKCVQKSIFSKNLDVNFINTETWTLLKQNKFKI